MYMPFQVIVITQNQSLYIKPMVDALSSSFPGISSLFVVDRSTDNSIEILKALNQPYIFNSAGEGFLAGYSRDLGLSYLINLNSRIENTLFLDGDRISVGFNCFIIEQALSLYDICLASTVNDYRKTFKDDFAFNPDQGKFNNGVFSCGLLIRKEMIEKILRFQGGRLFHKDFDGSFGEEDRYTGDIVYHLGGTCGMFPKLLHLSGDSFSQIKDWNKYSIQVNKRKILRRKLGLYD